MVTSAARELHPADEPEHIARVLRLAAVFAARAPAHDRDASFPFENFADLSREGLLALTVPAALGGGGAGARDATRVLGIIGKADPSTALVLSMHYIQHLVMAHSTRWPGRLSRKLARETVEGVALINALRVEPELGSPARGGLPATTARRTETGWRLTGKKIYSTGAPILKWYSVWAKTDEPETRVGLFLVPAGLPGTRIEESWDHLGLRASGSHTVIFDDVVFPLDYEIDVRRPDDWKVPDVTQATVHAIFVAAIYDGIARAARDWLVEFLKQRVPANLGAPLATLPRMQEVVGAIEARLAVNARLIDSFAADFDNGFPLSAIESNIIKLTVTNNAAAVVEDALSLTSNHGLSRTNPLERHYRDVLCGRVHTPQDDATRVSAGRSALGV
ncbi:alkylation response protein AidB-like acyl-CoA dehydrogenase [Bradyrhizobium sp. USDA 4524]|uniref:acyl-CoA dehydrogenase family protein n=1 Tax=unclassified Bradyrhizobium TaxID=2631580 RepID=UPI00209FDC1E|nr:MULTISPECIES: acyl-CoA dehydrogenase family protein [unclassified Bradyrhizobium]MCP1837841.1 alkylation response protein AidB-like acyl-CoA dehydrogenase [Bradyrhizobium sp. USDA 4538]MCP1898405.1 alkylation response protein AidB-like acyl-CoA dehydrogenase [Bradyrhizobium sp. USDA 4537]MCP1987485.1 alkylation response protein AidB-like acyl-CoA dehydrogenase [Bradyrhizobium sp. USDA 4539]